MFGATYGRIGSRAVKVRLYRSEHYAHIDLVAVIERKVVEVFRRSLESEVISQSYELNFSAERILVVENFRNLFQKQYTFG